MTFLPSGYTFTPSSGSGDRNYLRLQQGKNKVRILSDAVVGFVYWTFDNKPVRTRQHPGNPSDIRMGKDGKPERVKEFWAIIVWDYANSQVAIWELTQASIKSSIIALIEDEDWGDPKQYDLNITKSGSGLDTEYAVNPAPVKPLPETILEAYTGAEIDLQTLFSDRPPAQATAVGAGGDMSDIPF